MEDPSEQERTLVAQRIAHYVHAELEWEGSEAVLLSAEAAPLPAELDSTQLLELAGFAEDEYGVVFDDDELNATNFQSVWALADLVLRKSDGDLD